jgi:hypothetical protein
VPVSRPRKSSTSSLPSVMYVSGERAWCLRRVILGRGVSCNECGFCRSFIIENAQWSTTSPPTLEVVLNCANCGTGATTQLRCKRPGVAASTTLTKAYAKAVHSPVRYPSKFAD